MMQLVSSRMTKRAAILSCFLLLGTPVALAQPLSDTERQETEVIAKKRVEKNVPGTYHYQSTYEITKDKKGTYRSTYQSQKKQWFCCLDWFSSEETSSTSSDTQ